SWPTSARRCSPRGAFRSRIPWCSARSSPSFWEASSFWVSLRGCFPRCLRTGPRSRRTLPPCLSSRRTRRRSGAVLAVTFCAALGLLGPVAQGNEVPRLTFALLVDSLRANFGVAQAIASYNGKEVEIQGFIIPAGPPDLSFFLLSRVSALGNYCCEVPVGQDETVYVFATKGLKILYDPLRVYKIRGVFEAGMRPD